MIFLNFCLLASSFIINFPLSSKNKWGVDFSIKLNKKCHLAHIFLYLFLIY